MNLIKEFEEGTEAETVMNRTEKEKREEKQKMKLIKILIIILFLAASALFFIAGRQLSISGDELTRLRSVGGTSIAEAYYQEVGRYGHAFSYFSYALGIICLSIPLVLTYTTKNQSQHEEGHL